MGSWIELDAVYPPGALTPGAAFVIAHAHLHRVTRLYDDNGALARFVPHPGRGLVPDRDLLDRAERYLTDVPFDAFLAEARALLNRDQLRCLALNLLDAVLSAGERPESHDRYRAIVEGLGVTADMIDPYRYGLVLKNDLSLFPQ
ncbi:MAG: hypothetical protein HXY39_12715 [Chloroflexi bacterium]|nr:hypothetical protein [Chloroflexota bacterium]